MAACNVLYSAAWSVSEHEHNNRPSHTPRRPVSQCVDVPGMQRLSEWRSGGGQLDTSALVFQRVI